MNKKKLLIIVLIIFFLIFIYRNLIPINYEDLSLNNKNMLDNYNSLYQSKLWKGLDFTRPMVLIEKGNYLNNKDNTINLLRKNIFILNIESNSPFLNKVKMPKNYKLQNVYRVSRLSPISLKTLSPIGNFSSLDSNLNYKNYNIII